METQPEPVAEPVKKTGGFIKDYNLDKLAYAIAMQETADCTRGMGVTKNNCFGIMKFWYENGVRHRTGKTYASKEESYADFKRIWEKGYGVYPNFAVAEKWTGKDRASIWLRNVNYFYNQ